MKRKILALLLSVCMIVVSPMTALAEPHNSKFEPAVENIKSIQGYTDFCFYGQKLTKVEIKYNDNIDLSRVTPDTFTLLDRGYANPDFAEVIIDSVKIKGKTVILNITEDTEALPGNEIIYSGDNTTGSRKKNPMGLYSTGPWYRDVNGVIYFGTVDTAKYKANTIKDGYQTRECLELKLYHTGETEVDAACLANEDGSYNADGLWFPTIDANYGKSGFQTFEELDIEVPTTATDDEEYVRGFAYFPKGYNKNSPKKYPMIITITGNGTSLWVLPDGTNNFGTGLNFDGSGFQWMNSDAIVLNIHDRSHTGGDDYKYWVDDKNVIDYFIKNYNADPKAITLTGNSRGTMAIGKIYQEYPGIANTLIINNGSMGSGWTSADWQNAANYGTRIWAFDGEQDTDNIAAYKTAITYYKAAGWSDKWIAENIRITGFPTQLYHYWGETDHSSTKMTYWYFYDKPYYGPNAKIVNGEMVYNTKLKVGDTYQINGKLVEGVYNKKGFNYVIYGETLRDWVMTKSKIESKQNIPKGNEITKAEFVAKVSDYFAWPHPEDYNDIWKAPLKQFNDVKITDKYGKQIEVAYEEGIISPDSIGNFNPERGISRQDAAVILVNAFKIPKSENTVKFSDSDTIREDAKGSVNALVELGYMNGKTAKSFIANDLINKNEVDQIFKKITSAMVSPVQAVPKQTVEPYTAPRRFIKLYTPTDGAKIYYTKASSIEGWPTVEEPTTSSDEYVIEVNGHISELVGARSGELVGPDNYVVYKAIAVKAGKASPVQTFKWHLNRPMDGEFLYEQLKEKTSTSPAVYEIFRNNESVRAMAWYVEGADSGIIFDALQTPAGVKNLKTFIDENIATKPYISILGHEHGDHDAQIPNFIEGGIDVYANKRGWAAIGTPGGFGAVVTTKEEQAKVKNVEEGMTFDLGGGTIFEVYALPGHANGNVALYDRQSGYLFSSDFYGCTRAGSADTVGISGVRADLLLSFVQQVYSKYTKDDSEVIALFTGHDESQLSDNNLQLFEAALQQVIDNGEDGCTPSVRGGSNRTTMIGDMYKDGTNWIALELGGKMGDDREYLSSTTDLSVVPYMSDPENAGLNYNAGDHVKYSVLSNIEIEGGELEGKTVQWAKDANEFQWNGETMTVNPSLENRFNPWSYNYTIKVPESNNSITIIPTTMSTNVKSIKLNGKNIEYRSSNVIPVSNGSVITINVVAPDKVTTSTYTFTIDKY